MRKSTRTLGRKSVRNSIRKTTAATRVILDSLEQRRLLAANLWVNDNWVETVNNGLTVGVVEAGDTVEPALGDFFTGGMPGAGTLTFGIDAFSTIPDAVLPAVSGDTVSVISGTYTSAGDVTENITFLGAQHGVDARTRMGIESVISAANGAIGIGGSTVGVVMDGFTIQGQTGAGGPGFGAAIRMVPGTSGNQVVNNIIQNNVIGIFLTNAGPTQGLIQNNLFRDNTNAGPSGGTSIYADQFTAGVGGVTNVLIDGNTFTNSVPNQNTWALGLSNTNATPFTNITFSNNDVSNHGRGVYGFNVTGLTIDGNSFSVIRYAVGMFDAPPGGNATVTDNEFTIVPGTTSPPPAFMLEDPGSTITVGLDNTFFLELNEDSSISVNLNLDGSGVDEITPLPGIHGIITAPPTPPFNVVSFTPNANYAGTAAEFSFNLGSDAPIDDRTVTVTVNPVNDAPTFAQNNASVSVAEDSGAASFTGAGSINLGPAGVSLGIGDESTQTGSFVVSAPTGDVSFSVNPTISPSGVLSFTPAANDSGTATFTAFLQDNGGTANGGDDTSATVTYTITVTASNDAPNAVDDDYTSLGVTEDTTSASLDVQANDTDVDNTFPLAITHVDGNPITVGVPYALPTGALLTLNPDGTFGYNPSASAALNALAQGATVNEVFTYRLSDGSLNDTATVTVTVTGVNDNPGITGGTSYSINENSVANFGAFTGSDPDVLNSLTYAIGTSAGGPFGASATAALGTFAISASPVNGNPAGLSITPSDVNYEASATHSQVLYIRATDSSGGTTTFGPVTVSVNDVNEQITVAVPSATINMSEDGTFTFNGGNTFTVSDPDNNVNNLNTYTYSITVAATNGEVTLDGITAASRTISGTNLNTLQGLLSAMQFTPTSNFPTSAASGVATLTISATDGGTPATPATKNVTVFQNNDAPTLSPVTDTFTFNESPGTEVALFPGLSLTDIESNGMTTATITASGWVSGQDVLTSPGVGAGITGVTYVSGTGSLTVVASPAATIAQIVAFLQQVKYDNSSMSPTLTPRVFTLTVTDNGTGNGTSPGTTANPMTSSGVTSTITITPSNDPPIAGGDAYLAIEDLPFNQAAPGVLSNDSDVDGPAVQVLEFRLVGGGSETAAGGTLSLGGGSSVTLNANGSFTYSQGGKFNTLAAGQFGADQFEYRLIGSTSWANVSISIAGVNDAPVANNDGPYVVSEDGPILSVPASGILGNDTDVDSGTTLTATTVSYSGAGTLIVNANGSFTFNPGVDYQNLDTGESVTETFTYRASDGITTSNLATVTITINGANDAPVISPTDYTFSIAENAVASVGSVTATDVDVESLTYSITSGASPFSINPSTGLISATGTQDFETQTSHVLTVQVFDGTANAATAATVTINITNVNEAPVANGDTGAANEDGPATTHSVLANDIDPDTGTSVGLTVTAVSAPTGSVSTNGTNVVFNPNGQFESLAQGQTVVIPVTYTVDDGSAPSSSGTLLITVTGQNDAPTVANLIPDQNGDQGTSFSYTFPANTFADVDAGTTLAYGATGVPSWLTFNPSTRTFTGTPGPSDTGTFTISVTASDGIAPTASDTFLVTIVDDFNDPPIASPTGTTATVNEDGTVTVDVITGALGGPGAESSQTVFLNPILVTPPTNGTFNVNAVAGTIQYIPNPDYFGSDLLVYRIADSGAPTAQTDVTLSITINSVNDAPSFTNGSGYGDQVVNEDSAVTTVASFANVPINVGPANESGQTASFVVSSTGDVAFTTLAVDSSGNLIFQPAANDSGTATVTLYAQDDGGVAFGGDDTSNPVQTFTITVNEVNDDAPVAVNDSLSGNENAIVTGNVKSANPLTADSDADTAFASLLIKKINGVNVASFPHLEPLANGSLTINADGSFSYDHNGNDSTSDSFTYTLTDGPNESNTATVTFSIANVTPTVLAGADDTVPQATPFNRMISFTDPGVEGVNGWTVSVDWGDGSALQTFTVSAAGAYALPTHTFLTTGTKTVTVSVDDGEGVGSDAFLINVTANPFVVTSFTPTASGFDVTFNRDFDLADLNLWGMSPNLPSPSGTAVPADVTLVGPGGNVRGSMIFTGSNSLSFVATRTAATLATGGALAPGMYTATLVSGSSAFNDLVGLALDGGAGDSTPGGTYTSTFSVGAGRVLSLPDFSRAPGQNDIDLPEGGPLAARNYIPVTLSEASGVEAVDFTLTYDPAKLNITNILLDAGMPGDWSITVNLTVPGTAVVSASGTTALGAGVKTIFRIDADVPSGAYGSNHVLNITSTDVQVAGFPVASIGDLAVHSRSLVGDSNADGVYTGGDASLISQNAALLRNGFNQWNDIDPIVISDVNFTASLSGGDASLISQEVAGLNPNAVPDLTGPRGLPGLPEFAVGTARLLGPATAVAVGGLVRIPVGVSTANTDGPAMMFDISFDSSLLSLDRELGIQATTLANSLGLNVVFGVLGNRARVVIYGAVPVGTLSSDLFNINFQVTEAAMRFGGSTTVSIVGVDESAGQSLPQVNTKVMLGKRSRELGQPNSSDGSVTPSSTSIFSELFVEVVE